MSFTPPISLADLEKQSFPPGNFIIGNKLLPANGLMVIGGPPKSYKSFLCGSILYHLATGTHLFGTLRYPHGESKAAERMFEIPRPMRVLFLEQEIGFEDVRERLIGGIPWMLPANAELFRENVFVHSRDMAMRLDRLDGLEHLDKLIGAIKPDVVCFDPLIEFHQRAENDASEMSSVFKNLDILREGHKFAAILSHHTSKPSEGGRSGADLLRGTSALFGKGDSFLMLNVSNRNAGLITIDYTIRRGKPLPSMTVRLDPENLTVKFHAMKRAEREHDLKAKSADAGSIN